MKLQLHEISIYVGNQTVINTMDLTSIAKYFISFGVLFLILGSILYFLGKAGIGFSKLPGDILIQKGNFTFYFPLMSCIIISIVLTIILSLFLRK